ncbi:hypothetical protein C0J52_04413 [Blattella germanica]|nr:hypothetical protein C0J52_04413 [Blattella germanica]
MTVRTLVHRGNGKFEISTNEQGLVVTGTAYIPDEVEKCYSNQPSEITGGIELTGDDVYMELEQRGYNYKEHFKGITQLRISNKGSVASIKWKNKWVPFCEMIVQLIILHSGEKSQSLHLPLSIKKVVFNPLKHKADTEGIVYKLKFL